VVHTIKPGGKAYDATSFGDDRILMQILIVNTIALPAIKDFSPARPGKIQTKTSLTRNNAHKRTRVCDGCVNGV
jgi:hypothetical protein